MHKQRSSRDLVAWSKGDAVDASMQRERRRTEQTQNPPVSARRLFSKLLTVPGRTLTGRAPRDDTTPED